MSEALPEIPADVLTRLGDAVDHDAGRTPEAVPPAQPSNEEPAAPVAPEGSTTEEAATSTDSFTRLDPSTLPAEVRPYYESMQSDYTRKTQEVAPWRKMAEELGVSSPDEIRQAAELFAYLQDPNNLRDFHAQVGQMIGVEGQPPAATPPAPGTDPFAASELDDPAIAAIKQELAAVREQLNARAQAEEQERLQMALLGEMNRQEAVIREEHPDWGDEEWNAVYEMAPFYEGNLMHAAARVDAAANARVQRLLASKAAVQETPGLSIPTPRAEAVTPREVGNDPELREATAEALAYLKAVANGTE